MITIHRYYNMYNLNREIIHISIKNTPKMHKHISVYIRKVAHLLFYLVSYYLMCIRPMVVVYDVQSFMWT